MKSLIENYVSDPTKRYKRKWIYASMPSITKSQTTFPFIVINSPDVSQEGRDFDTGRRNNFRCLITVVSDDESEVDSISDQIQEALIEHENELNEEGLYNPEVASSPFNMDADQNGKKVYSRPIGVIAGGWI